MEIKNITKMNKKGSIKDIMIIVITGILLFSAFLSFTTDNAVQSGVELPGTYNDSYNRLARTQENLSATTDEIRDSMQDITEADNTILAAFYGMKGFLVIFKLPLKILSPILIGLSTVLDMVGIVTPPEVIIAITIGITIIIVFAFLRFLTQRGNDA